jgi:hypothetical protein
MKTRPRYQELWRQLAGLKPMVFMAGPRQAGKTTLARQLAGGFANQLYFNYDIMNDRQRLLANPYFYEGLNRRDARPPLVVLDEIHKYHDWKNYLKGVFDRDSAHYQFLVSGSGRLDVRQKGGDSLAGRYLLFHLWPFTLAELMGRPRPVREFLADPLAVEVTAERARRQTWTQLARWGGFPEPFLKGRDDFYALWARQYLKQLIREDILSLVAVQKVGQMELLMALLPSKIGSPIALHNLAGDIGVSFDSVKSWLGVFESFFLAFQVPPWTRKLARAILKEKKVYLLNPALVSGEGARFENQVAVELWRAVHAWSEAGVGDFSLHYVRTKDGLEVDFLIAEQQRPLLLVEAKQGAAEPAAALLKLQGQLQVPAVQLVNRPGLYRHAPGARPPLLVISAEHWLAGLP